MKKTVIFGAGGFGREVKMLLDQVNAVQKKFDFAGYYDDNLEIATKINNHEVLGNLEDLSNIEVEVNVIIAIGNPLIKYKVLSDLDVNIKLSFPELIHPSVYIGSESVKIGRGVIVCAGCIITCNIEIEDFVILNLSCTVGHDTVIRSFSSLMPSVNLSGEVTINQGVYIGTGAKIINQVEIGRNTIVGAGAVVSKSLPENCTAVGIPAKPIKFHE